MTQDRDSLETRIVQLEERFSHQDYLITELNKIVADQQSSIDFFRSELRALSELGESNSNSLKDDVPPHY